ncbi:MAG: SDR family oxidoreductase [Candidatus Heimdallarchaeota archaeon]
MPKRFLITGATGGLGRAIVGWLDKSDNEFYLVSRKPNKAKELFGDLKSPHEILKCDLTHNQEVKDALQSLNDLDVVVNNAGIVSDGLVHKMSFESWNKVLSLNLTGAFLVTKQVIPKMKKFGHILNISSVLSARGVVGAANYAASKGGLEAFTIATAKELIRKKIFVNVLRLGFYEAGMGLRLPDQVKQSTLERIPLREFGDPEEVGRAISWIISSRYLVGQIISLDGGYSI